MATIATALGWRVDAELWRCVACHGALVETDLGAGCPACGRAFPIRDGILIVQDEVAANNRIARDFYDSPDWPKFRFWEWLTFLCNGGERRSRNKILRHLPRQENLKLLDVAVGDGVYLDWLPHDWSVVGIDISPVQLAACRDRLGAKGREIPLVLGEAEDLPFQDHRFDAVLSIGGFNYFNDPERSLREMARVAKPGSTIIVADEVPNLTDRVFLGRMIGLPGLDRWIIRRVTQHLGDDFNRLVERYHDLDVAAIGRRVLPDCHYELIWQGVGYVLVGHTPANP
jgi:ubiquinone/menaquinone biosynthesis C-methylase UbiE